MVFHAFRATNLRFWQFQEYFFLPFLPIVVLSVGIFVRLRPLGEGDLVFLGKLEICVLFLDI